MSDLLAEFTMLLSNKDMLRQDASKFEALSVKMTEVTGTNVRGEMEAITCGRLLRAAAALRLAAEMPIPTAAR